MRTRTIRCLLGAAAFLAAISVVHLRGAHAMPPGNICLPPDNRCCDSLCKLGACGTVPGPLGPCKCPTGCSGGLTCQNHQCAAPPYPQPQTRVGQALVSVGDYTYVFVVGLDGRVLYTKWKLGSTWTAWWTLGTTDVRTDAAPAATIVNNYLFVTVAGRDNKLHLNQAGTNPTGAEVWVGWQ